MQKFYSSANISTKSIYKTICSQEPIQINVVLLCNLNRILKGLNFVLEITTSKVTSFQQLLTPSLLKENNRRYIRFVLIVYCCVCVQTYMLCVLSIGYTTNRFRSCKFKNLLKMKLVHVPFQGSRNEWRDKYLIYTVIFRYQKCKKYN